MQTSGFGTLTVPGTVDADFPDLPTSGSVAAVIAYARAQIGKPYIFATAGPTPSTAPGSR